MVKSRTLNIKAALIARRLITLINVYFNNEIKIEIWMYKGQDSRIKKKKYYKGEGGISEPYCRPSKK